MPDDDNKLRVYLCSDHFERLCSGDVCSTCPSRVENSEAVKALAKVYETDASSLSAAVITELQSIRRSQREQGESVSQLSRSISGSDPPGIFVRLTRLEAERDARHKSANIWLVVIGLLLSSLIGASTLIVSMVMK